MYTTKIKYFQHVLRLTSQRLSFNDIWQLKLINSYLQHYRKSHILFSKELITSYIEQFHTFVENCRQQLAVPLRQFINSRDFEPHIVANLSLHEVSRMIAVVIFYQLTPNLLNVISQRPTNYLGYIREFQKLQLDPTTTQCLLKVLQATSA